MNGSSNLEFLIITIKCFFFILFRSKQEKPAAGTLFSYFKRSPTKAEKSIIDELALAPKKPKFEQWNNKWMMVLNNLEVGACEVTY